MGSSSRLPKLHISIAIAPSLWSSIIPPIDAALTIIVALSRRLPQNHATIFQQTKLTTSLASHRLLHKPSAPNPMANSTPLPTCICPKTCALDLTCHKPSITRSTRLLTCQDWYYYQDVPVVDQDASERGIWDQILVDSYVEECTLVSALWN